MSVSRPVSVAVVNDFPVVVAGVMSLLQPFRDQFRLEEHVGGMPARGRVDVVLWDPFGRADVADRLREIRRVTGSKVVVYSWAVSDRQIDHAMQAGASGYLAKTVDGPRMVEALLAIAAGETVRGAPATGEGRMADWPGQAEGLSPRESEILALIVAGLSNQEVANATFLSINSVKTYVRTAYRKMGVESRSEALLWGLRHGFLPGPPSARTSDGVKV